MKVKKGTLIDEKWFEQNSEQLLKELKDSIYEEFLIPKGKNPPLLEK